MKKASVFDRIDNYFESQPNKNVFYMVIFLIVLVFGYLIYDNTYTDSEDYLTESNTKLDNSKNTLANLNNFINTNKQNLTIQRLNQDLANLQKQKEDTDKQNQYFDSKLSEASKLLYNQKNWSNFMAKVNMISNKYNLILDNVQSNINDLSSMKVEEAFNVTFSLEGKFQNILHFINDLESSVDVVDVRSLRFNIIDTKIDDNNNSNSKPKPKKPNGNISANIAISIWGIQY